MDPLEGVRFVTERGTLPEGQTLQELIGAEKYSAVAKLAGSLDVPEIFIARLEPWAAAMVLTQFALAKTGFDPQLGIDMQLMARARADGKEVAGLETVVDQLGIFEFVAFDAFPESADNAFVRGNTNVAGDQDLFDLIEQCLVDLSSGKENLAQTPDEGISRFCESLCESIE